MNEQAGEFKLPPCEHNQPFTGTVTVTAPPTLTCPFCEMSSMRDEIVALRPVATAAKAWRLDEDSQAAPQRSQKAFELLCAVDDLVAGRKWTEPAPRVSACSCLRGDCEVCAAKTPVDVHREVLREHRHNLLRTWQRALEIRLDYVDLLLPEPTLFQMVLGRRRWHQVRDEARRLLQVEHMKGWVDIMNAKTLDEMLGAIDARGPNDAAQGAIDAAKGVE